MHPFTQEKEESTRQYRLWALDLSVTIDVFESYLISSLRKNDNEYLENISFPGIILDKYENDCLGEIEELLNDKIIILEYKKPSNSFYNSKDYFIFKKEKINYIDNFIKVPLFDSIKNLTNIDATTVNNYFTKVGLCPISFYEDYLKFDSLVENKKLNYLENTNSIFPISNYFTFKYGINMYNFEFFLSKKGTPDFINEKNRLLQEEISYAKNNLEEIYEKQDIINKFGIFFAKTDKNSNYYQINQESNKLQEEKVLSRYQQIMKKRNKKSIKPSIEAKNQHKMENPEIKTEFNSEIKLISLGKIEERLAEKDNKTDDAIALVSISLNEKQSQDNLFNLNKVESSNMTCNYCNREIEEDEEFEKCENCNEFFYCNSACKNKDSKFHKKKCKNK